MLVVLSRFNVSIVLSVYSGLNSAPAGLIFVVYDANGAEFTNVYKARYISQLCNSPLNVIYNGS